MNTDTLQKVWIVEDANRGALIGCDPSTPLIIEEIPEDTERHECNCPYCVAVGNVQPKQTIVHKNRGDCRAECHPVLGFTFCETAENIAESINYNKIAVSICFICWPTAAVAA